MRWIRRAPRSHCTRGRRSSAAGRSTGGCNRRRNQRRTGRTVAPVLLQPLVALLIVVCANLAVLVYARTATRQSRSPSAAPLATVAGALSGRCSSRGSLWQARLPLLDDGTPPRVR